MLKRIMFFSVVLLSITILLGEFLNTNIEAYANLIDVDDYETIVVKIDGGEVYVNIDENLLDFFDDTYFLELVKEYDLAPGDRINITDVYEFEEISEQTMMPPQARMGFHYQTTVTPVRNSERVNSRHFITSVARGETLTLSKTFTRTYTVGITTGTGQQRPWQMNGSLGASLTFTRSVGQQFVGPPETSRYNTREFRVRLYNESINWTQRRVNLNGTSIGEETRSGTGARPTRFVSYSLDRLTR